MDKVDEIKRVQERAREELAALEELLADSPHAEVDYILKEAQRRLAQELLEL